MIYHTIHSIVPRLSSTGVSYLSEQHYTQKSPDDVLECFRNHGVMDTVCLVFLFYCESRKRELKTRLI